MSILWLAAICAALGIGCLLMPWHIGMTGVCLLLLAAVMTACHFLRGEKGKRWRRVLWSLAALGMALVFGMMGFIALDGRDLLCLAVVLRDRPARFLPDLKRTDDALFVRRMQPRCGLGVDRVQLAQQRFAALGAHPRLQNCAFAG